MKPKVRVIVNESSFELNMSNNVTGQIYLKVDERVFPEEGWYDFPVIILGWWLQSMANILKAPPGTSCEFGFMDGPLLVRGIKNDFDSLNLSFVKNKLNGEIVFFTAICNTKQLRNSLLSASRKVINFVEEAKSWRTDDVQELKKYCNMLSQSDCNYE